MMFILTEEETFPNQMRKYYFIYVCVDRDVNLTREFQRNQNRIKLGIDMEHFYIRIVTEDVGTLVDALVKLNNLNDLL